LILGAAWGFLLSKMFIRKKKNPTGTVTIQVVDKGCGTYRVVQNFGVASSEREQAQLLNQAKAWMDKQSGLIKLDLYKEDEVVEQVFNSIQSLKRAGLELVLGKIFDEIGFNKIADPIFRQLVFYRLIYPASKLKTTEYLYRYEGIYWDENKVYRYLDKLYDHHKELVEQISYEHTLSVLNGAPQVVFYDVTTIYFEVEQEDQWRRTGFSKEGKHQNPQIVLGLLVSTNGYPLAYQIFDGKQFEGHTLLPVVEAFKVRYKLDKLVVVADAGLLSNQNIALLAEHKYEFILGARIKNESRTIEQQILSHTFSNGTCKSFNRGDGHRMLVSFSTSGALKDAAYR
jgi:hypothetical protein